MSESSRAQILDEEVVVLVRQIGRSSVDRVLPHLPQARPHHVRHALARAARQGRLSVQGHGPDTTYEWVRPRPARQSALTGGQLAQALSSRAPLELSWAGALTASPPPQAP